MERQQQHERKPLDLCVAKFRPADGHAVLEEEDPGHLELPLLPRPELADVVPQSFRAFLQLERRSMLRRVVTEHRAQVLDAGQTPVGDEPPNGVSRGIERRGLAAAHG